MSPNTRDQILTAALTVFGQKGFHGATIPDLASEAGVGAGTIYRHFKSKEDVGSALYNKWKQHYVDFIVDGLPSEGAWRTRFQTTWQLMVDYAAANPGVLEYLEFHHHSTYLVEDEDNSNRLNQAMGAMVMQGQADGVLVAGSPVLLLNMMYGAFLRILRQGSSGAMDVTPEVFREAEERLWVMIRK